MPAKTTPARSMRACNHRIVTSANDRNDVGKTMTVTQRYLVGKYTLKALCEETDITDPI